jgi:hypothetical protein
LGGHGKNFDQAMRRMVQNIVYRVLVHDKRYFYYYNNHFISLNKSPVMQNAFINNYNKEVVMAAPSSSILATVHTAVPAVAQTNPMDPLQKLPSEVFGKILAMANVRTAAPVSRQWRDLSIAGYIEILGYFRSSPLLRRLLPDVVELSHCREAVLRAVGRLQAHLRDLDPRAAAILSDPSFPIGHVALLERLEADATLSKFFDRLLDQIPPQQRPHLPDNFNERVTFIREWINNHANDAVLALVTDIHLDQCSLYSLPPEIGRLANLQTLYLYNNHLTALPPEIGRLANLQSLYLYNNHLTALQREIGQLTHLQELWVDQNQLTTLPQEIGQLVNLHKLNLRFNQLTTLPPEIGRLVSLQDLDLSYNQLTTLPPQELGQLTHLQELWLSHNQLTTLPPEIGQLVNLQKLGLDSNQLASLPQEIGQLGNLRKLFLMSNPLTEAIRSFLKHCPITANCKMILDQ